MVSHVCGHLHDLGNPPFGHAGEDAIKMWFECRGAESEFWDGFGLEDPELQKDFTHFDGNAQTLRLVSGLQVLADTNGLNLTSAAFTSLIKYLADCHSVGSGDGEFKKLGFFQTEAPLVLAAQEEAGLISGDSARRHPVTFLVEAADDIVYGICDIEDAIKKRILSWQDVGDDLEEAEKTGNWSSEQRDQMAGLAEASRRWIDNRIHGLDDQYIDLDEAYAEHFRTRCIGFGVRAVADAFLSNYEGILEGTYRKELLYDSKAGGLYDCLKNTIGVNKIYRCREATELEILGTRVIHGLLDLFVEAFNTSRTGHATTSRYPTKIESLFSKNYRQVYEQSMKSGSIPEGYYRLRLLTDYICGMTDSFALNLFHKLTYAR